MRIFYVNLFLFIILILITICTSCDDKMCLKLLKHLLPSKEKVFLKSDKEVEIILDYFLLAGRIIEEKSSFLVYRAFYNLIGGYLASFLIPMAKCSFYAGNLNFYSVESLMDFYEEIKEKLDTNGNQWPNSSFYCKMDKMSVEKIEFFDDNFSACANFVILDEFVRIPMPKLEIDRENDEILTIWLPFVRQKHVFHAKTRTSSFILMKYLGEATKCLCEDENLDLKRFHKKLKFWIERNVLTILNEDDFYPIFGAVFRILETINGFSSFKRSTEPENMNSSQIEVTSEPDSKDNVENGHENEENPKFVLPEWLKKEMIMWLIYIIGSLILLLIICCFCCRLKKNTKKIKDKNMTGNEQNKKDGSIRQRLKSSFSRSKVPDKHENDAEEIELFDSSQVIMSQNRGKTVHEEVPQSGRFKKPLLSVKSGGFFFFWKHDF